MTAADHANTVHRSSADYIDRTIATVRNHKDADNCWPQWANIFADEIEDLRADLDALEAQAEAEAAERIDPVDGLTGDERAHRRDNALNYGEIERLRKVLKAAQAASASWQLYKAQMEAEGAEYDTAPGSAPVLMDELAHALAALATDRTETQP